MATITSQLRTGPNPSLAPMVVFLWTEPRGEQLWIGSRDTVVPGFVLGYDFDSGLALVKPSLPLHGPAIPIGRADELAVGDSVTVIGSGGKEQHMDARVVAKQEFAGRWEYVLDQAVFTTPPKHCQLCAR